MANFSYARAEYSDAAKSWQLVKDCVAGSRAIKDQGILYLPMPDPTNDSDENKARYEALLKRAMFLNITGRTRQGLIGAVFRKTADPLYIDRGTNSIKSYNAFGSTEGSKEGGTVNSVQVVVVSCGFSPSLPVSGYGMVIRNASNQVTYSSKYPPVMWTDAYYDIGGYENFDGSTGEFQS